MRSEFAEFSTRNEDAKEASRRVEGFLRSCVKVLDVRNVEDDREYQLRDIDLLCTLKTDSGERTISIEIKGDRKAHVTGNFFFETVSNEALETEGCFLKSQADLLFYYLMETDRLYVFPMSKIRGWFLRTREQLTVGSSFRYDSMFKLRKTHTVDSSGNYSHTTVGRCVDIEYTKRCLRAENITFGEIEGMSKCRCMLQDFCLSDI